MPILRSSRRRPMPTAPDRKRWSRARRASGRPLHLRRRSDKPLAKLPICHSVDWYRGAGIPCRLRQNTPARPDTRGAQMSQAAMTLSERADELEEQMMHELNEKIATKSVLFGMADGKVEIQNGNDMLAKNPGKYFLMGADNRLPLMPDKPTLIDFFKLRLASTAHLLQSAKHALRHGLPGAIVRACLLHDIVRVGFIRCGHGYWGAQMIEPYVDEEVSWAIRMHQCLRFFPDESVGYKLPDQY